MAQTYPDQPIYAQARRMNRTFNGTPNNVEQERILRQLRQLSKIMDSAITFPGTRRRFGLDSIIGLIPGIGDTATTLISLYIVYQASQLGVSKGTLARMLANVGVDAAIGAIPLVGDIFDFAFKANVKNLELLGITREQVDNTYTKYH